MKIRNLDQAAVYAKFRTLPDFHNPLATEYKPSILAYSYYTYYNATASSNTYTATINFDGEFAGPLYLKITLSAFTTVGDTARYSPDFIFGIIEKVKYVMAKEEILSFHASHLFVANELMLSEGQYIAACRLLQRPLQHYSVDATGTSSAIFDPYSVYTAQGTTVPSVTVIVPLHLIFHAHGFGNSMCSFPIVGTERTIELTTVTANAMISDYTATGTLVTAQNATVSAVSVIAGSSVTHQIFSKILQHSVTGYVMREFKQQTETITSSTKMIEFTPGMLLEHIITIAVDTHDESVRGIAAFNVAMPFQWTASADPYTSFVVNARGQTITNDMDHATASAVVPFDLNGPKSRTSIHRSISVYSFAHKLNEVQFSGSYDGAWGPDVKLIYSGINTGGGTATSPTDVSGNVKLYSLMWILNILVISTGKFVKRFS